MEPGSANIIAGTARCLVRRKDRISRESAPACWAVERPDSFKVDESGYFRFFEPRCVWLSASLGVADCGGDAAEEVARPDLPGSQPDVSSGGMKTPSKAKRVRDVEDKVVAEWRLVERRDKEGPRENRL